MHALKIGLTICLLTTPAWACLSQISHPPTREVQATGASRLEQEMLTLINQERKKHELGELKWDKQLATVARAHNQDMLRRNYFEHEDLEGRTLKDRLLAAKIPFSQAGENISFAPNLARAHQGLMRSPEHRANILRPEFQRVGIGILIIPKGSHYVPRVNGRTERVPAGEIIVTQDFASEEF